MALIKFASTVGQVSGKIGAVVYSHNRYGNYIRQLTIPTNPKTNRQNVARARLSDLAVRWNEILTSGQRDAWGVYASNVVVKNRLGDDVYLTGFNHFIRSNTAILSVGGSIVDDAPTLFNLPETDPFLHVTLSEADQKISVAWRSTSEWCSEAGGYLQINMGMPQLTNVKFFNGPWQYIGKVAGATPTPPTSPAEIDVSWPIAEGQLVWCQCRIIRADGRVSNFFRHWAVVGS